MTIALVRILICYAGIINRINRKSKILSLINILFIVNLDKQHFRFVANAFNDYSSFE